MKIGKHGRIASIAGAAAIAALVTAGISSGAFAQPSPDQCKAAFTEADSNADQRLTDQETANYDGADTNKDGGVTNAEFMQACEAGLFKAMTPN